MGGAGGRVIEVTNLNDSGAGSLRAALLSTGPRTVVFRVGGTITLKSVIELTAAHSQVTVAGQTAPGGGILIKGAGLSLYGVQDVILRHLRLHPGSATSGYGLILSGDFANQKAKDIIIDHCSIHWVGAQAVLLWDYVENVTFQWCLVNGVATGNGFEAMTDPGNGSHLKNITIHHSLFTHNLRSNPNLFADGPFHVINNVFYDWQNFGASIQRFGDGTQVNLIGNTYKRGPLSNTQRYAVALEGTVNPNGYVHVKDNIGPFRPDASHPDWAIVGSGYSGGNQYWTVPASGSLSRSTQWPASSVPVTVESSSAALNSVYAQAGATLPSRSSVDAKVITEAKNGSASMAKANLVNLGSSSAAPADTDKDGIPDTWETKYGLNPKDASDGSALSRSGSGYTNLEEYLNSL